MINYQWRVSKYDPTLRDKNGNFLGEGWTSVWDIGEMLSDGALTVEEYLRIESAYVSAATSFAVESGVFELSIVDLELRELDQLELANLGVPPIDPAVRLEERAVIPVSSWRDVICLILRDFAWAKLESDSFFIHFGQDYYMYVGSHSACEHSQVSARTLGLFVEKRSSPYS